MRVNVELIQYKQTKTSSFLSFQLLLTKKYWTAYWQANSGPDMNLGFHWFFSVLKKYSVVKLPFSALRNA